MWTAQSAGMRGIIFMVLSTFGFAGMHTIIRYVSDNMHIHPFEIAFFRNLFGVIVFAPWLVRLGFRVLYTQRLPMHMLRAALNVTAMFMFFTALTITPLARVTALSFTAPIFAALLSVVILRERFRIRRSVALVCGFAGTLVILRPGLIEIDLGSTLVLLAAVVWGFTMIVIRVLGRTESSITITAYMNLLLAVFAFVPTLFVWTTPTLEGWFWLVIIGIMGTLAQMALAQSLKEADASTVMPFDFLKLLWVSILGYVLFAQTVDLFTWVGAAIVLGSSIYIAYRESRVSGTSTTSKAVGPEV